MLLNSPLLKFWEPVSIHNIYNVSLGAGASSGGPEGRSCESILEIKSIDIDIGIETWFLRIKYWYWLIQAGIAHLWPNFLSKKLIRVKLNELETTRCTQVGFLKVSWNTTELQSSLMPETDIAFTWVVDNKSCLAATVSKLFIPYLQTWQ